MFVCVLSLSAGKTTVLSQLSLDYCSQGVNTLWGSFEIKNTKLARTMLAQFANRNFLPENKNNHPIISAAPQEIEYPVPSSSSSSSASDEPMRASSARSTGDESDPVVPQPTQQADPSLIHSLNEWADKFSQLPLYFMKFHGSSSVENVLDAMEYAVYVYDVEHILLDNLQFMLSDQGQTREKEREKMKRRL